MHSPALLGSWPGSHGGRVMALAGGRNCVPPGQGSARTRARCTFKPPASRSQGKRCGPPCTSGGPARWPHWFLLTGTSVPGSDRPSPRGGGQSPTLSGSAGPSLRIKLTHGLRGGSTRASFHVTSGETDTETQIGAPWRTGLGGAWLKAAKALLSLRPLRVFLIRKPRGGAPGRSWRSLGPRVTWLSSSPWWGRGHPGPRTAWLEVLPEEAA